jgi:hypothetical protein
MSLSQKEANIAVATNFIHGGPGLALGSKMYAFPDTSQNKEVGNNAQLGIRIQVVNGTVTDHVAHKITIHLQPSFQVGISQWGFLL